MHIQEHPHVRQQVFLPSAAWLLVNTIIWGIFGRAQALYRVRVCHFVFLGNHFHMLIVIDDPEHLASFIGYIKGEIAHAVRAEQERLVIVRARDKRTVLGPTALRRQSMLLEYEPKKFGRKMICICSDKELRSSYIAFFKELCLRARSVFERWKLGQLSEKIPPGLFAPRVPALASALPIGT
jgi:REP element-mobilizing transposase RayT